MLTIIGGFFFIIAVIGVIIFLPVIVIVIKTFIALKNNTQQVNNKNVGANQSAPRTSARPSASRAQDDDVIETTCTVINE